MQGWFKACKSFGFRVRVLSRFGFKANGSGFAKGLGLEEAREPEK